MPSVSEILLQHGRDVARAAETRGQARAQLATSLGAIPGQVINNYQQMTQFAQQRDAEKTQQEIRQSQATTGAVGARTATMNERDLQTYKEIQSKLPKIVENGIELTDVKRLNEELTAARIDPTPFVTHAQALNESFRQEYTARQTLVKTVVDQVASAGNDPDLAIDALGRLEKAKLVSPEEAAQYRAFIRGAEGSPLDPAAQRAKVDQLTKYLGTPRKPVEVSAGSQMFDPVTHQPVGPQVPKVETSEERAIRVQAIPDGQRSPDDQQWLDAYGTIKAPTSQSQMMRLPGVGDVPVSIIPNKGAPGSKYFYNGQDVSDKVRAIPPASVNINAAIEAAAKDFRFIESRPDPADPASNKIDPVTGLSPQAQWQLAGVYALTRQLPPAGLGNSARANSVRSALETQASGMAAAAGYDMAALQAEYRAKANELSTLTPVFDRVMTAANTGNRFLDLAAEQSKNVPRGSARIVNRYTQAVQKGFTDTPNLSQFELYIYSAAREYARVTTGSAASVAELTKSASEKADSLINAAQSPTTFAKVAEGMKADMNAVVGEQKRTLSSVSSNIAGFLEAIAPKAAAGAPPPPPQANAGGAPKVGDERTIGGVPAIWKTVDGKTGWYAK